MTSEVSIKSSRVLNGQGLNHSWQSCSPRLAMHQKQRGADLNYRLYQIDHRGSIEDVHLISARDDAAAWMAADTVAVPARTELWCADREIVRDRGNVRIMPRAIADPFGSYFREPKEPTCESC